MQKILGSISFVGAISLMFLGVLIVIVRASPSEEGNAVIIVMEQVMKFIIIIAGLSVLIFTIKFGHGKEE